MAKLKSNQQKKNQKKFQILSVTIIWEGQNYQTSQRQTSIYDNQKVITFHLRNYIFPLVPKLHGKIKYKLALLFSYNMSVSSVILTWHFCGGSVL